MKVRVCRGEMWCVEGRCDGGEGRCDGGSDV